MRRFGHGEALLVLGLYIAAQVAAAVLGAVGVSAYAAVRAPGDTHVLQAALAAAAPYLAFLSTLAGAGAVLSTSDRVIRHRGGETYRSAIGWAAGTWSQAAVGAGIGALVAGTYLLLTPRLFPITTEQQMGVLAEMGRTPGVARALWVIMALGIAPPLEEFLFRGVLYSGLARHWRPVTAAAITTGLFALIHVPETLYYWPALGAIVMLAVITVGLRMRTGAVGPALVAHLAYNTVIVIVSALPAAS